MTIPDIAIYGMGRFGRALSGALVAIGRAPQRTGGRKDGPQALLAGLKAGTLIVLSVRDGAIEEVGNQFAALGRCGDYSFAHASGAHGADLLEPLARAGAAVGAFHILQSFPPDNGAARVPGSWCAVSGDKPLVSQLRSLARALQMHPFDIPDAARPAYHAAAVLASNALVTLLAAGRELLLGAGLPAESAEKMLLPLSKGTLENVAAYGPEKALTGPVARGDAQTLRDHLLTLPIAVKPAYRAMMLETVAFAKRAGRVTAEQATALRRVLR